MIHYLTCVVLGVLLYWSDTGAANDNSATNNNGAATANNAPSDAKCREATQYDSSDNTIVKCPSSIACTFATNTCLRRGVEIPGYIGITYCSCLPLQQGDPFPNEVCHIYRWHHGATTQFFCNNEACADTTSCQVTIPDLTVKTCSCK